MRHRQSLHPEPRRNLPPLRLQPDRLSSSSIRRECTLRGVFRYRYGVYGRCVDDSDEYGSVDYDGKWIGDDDDGDDEFG